MHRPRPILIILVGLVLIAPLVLFSGGAYVSDWGRQIHRTDSLYNTIFVYERGSIVTLRFGRREAVPIQSQVNTRDLSEHMLEYSKMMFCGLFYQPRPERVLVLGLGGGVIPRQMHTYFPDAEIDAVEIDPAIPPIAEKYFGFQTDDKLKVYVDDGRIFIKKHLRDKEKKDAKYDYVVLDAFNGDYIPFHLMTREFLEEVRDVLTDDGVVVANVFYTNRLFDAEFRTFAEVFGTTQVYLGRESGNAMIAAVKPEEQALTMRQAVEIARDIQKDIEPSFSLPRIAGMMAEDIHPDPDVRILTDDRAPVNWLKEQDRNN